MQTIYMCVMFGTSLLSAMDWYARGDANGTLTFVGFAVGYLGLALTFRSM